MQQNNYGIQQAVLRQQGATNKSSSKCYYQLHIRLTEHGRATEYIFNFCNFGLLQFQAGRIPNALPNAKLWPLYAINQAASIMRFFDKLFGKQDNDIPISHPNLSPKSRNILEQHGFNLTKSSDNGMWKYYQWTNSEFQFSLTYDRGYYDCDVAVVNAEPDFRMSLIPLLKFLKKDRTFYNKELKEADLWRTLTPDGYVMLLDENYELVNNLFHNYHPDIFEKYKKFDFDYDGI